MSAEHIVTDKHAGAMALVRRLRALLDDEFEALKQQDLEWFERMQPTKLELLQSLAGVVPPESMGAAVDEKSAAGDRAQIALQMQRWDEFVVVMNECREAHRRNDVLIRSKLEAIRGTLRMLQSADDSNSVDIYDRLGRVGRGLRGRGYQDA